LIHDRDGKYPALFDAILADTGIRVVLAGVQVPRMNSADPKLPPRAVTQNGHR
jgi:hypothetical protein